MLTTIESIRGINELMFNGFPRTLYSLGEHVTWLVCESCSVSFGHKAPFINTQTPSVWEFLDSVGKAYQPI